jgi:hypothetical protein
VTQAYWRDLGERVATTYVVSFVGLLMAHGTSVLAVSSLRSAALAAIPASLSVVLGLIGAKVGIPGTASLLPKPKEAGSGGE